VAVELEDITVGAGEHVVQFYEHDSELARAVGGYLRTSLEDGAVAIVIATGAHREAFHAELEAAGIDTAAHHEDGTLIVLDAAATLAAFTHEGQVDRDGFRRTVGAVLRRAAETRKAVRAYGEMVALLWEAGDVLAAIELEEAWNELAGELPFALVCAYPSASVEGHEHADALEQVCHLHSSVLRRPPAGDSARASARRQISARFPAERTAPRDARHFVADALKRWGHSPALVGDAQLVVTELATNAIVHAGSPFSVELQPNRRGVRLAVGDFSPMKPVLREGELLGTSGRGLRLIGALAADWGVELSSDGKTIWADLHADGRPAD
jgi:anti-sigma regulatory factor (Ser/Thr protein kinase)